MTAKVHQLTTPPLTEEEVFAICDELKNEGQSVTRRAVAKRVGRGSMTTIVRMVSLWEDKQIAHAEARDVELTADDTETVLTFGRQMLRTLTERIRQHAAEETARLERAAEIERRRASEIAAAYDELEVETKQKLDKAKVEADEAAQELQDEINDLKAKITRAESDLEAAKLVADNLNQELIKQTDRADREEKRAQSAESRISSEQLKAADAEGRARLLTEELAEIKDAFEKAEGSVNDLKAECSLRTQRAEAAERREIEIKDDLKKEADAASMLKSEVARLTAELRAEVNKSADLDTRLTDSEAKAAAANFRIDELLQVVKAEKPHKEKAE
jgi:chromosome segregation ATPase